MSTSHLGPSLGPHSGSHFEDFVQRKVDHINQALEVQNQALGMTGLERVRLHHDSLPELNFSDLSLETTSLGEGAPTPFFISGMTAGHSDASRINQVLASVCQKRGWALGVGSQRRDLESIQKDPHFDLKKDSVDQWGEFRLSFPRLKLFANLGMPQVIQAKASDILRVVQALEADGLVIHLNALQEALQPEGTPQYRGALFALQNLTSELGIPVLLKETGCGFSHLTLEKLKGIQLAAIDVSGLGGTHWGRIEGRRAQALSPQAVASQVFADWGESTVDSVLRVKEKLPGVEIWASGGVRTGLDAAKLIAMGATKVGFAQPALKAALEGQEKLDQWMEQIEFELKVALFCTGTKDPKSLGRKEGVWQII